MKPTPEMIEAAIVAHDKAYAEWSTRKKCMEAALTAALALVEPEEPVAWYSPEFGVGFGTASRPDEKFTIPLFASPPPPVDADAIIERCAQVADEHAADFERQAHQTENPTLHDGLFTAADGCELTAEAIRALKSSPKQDNGQVIG